MIRPPFLSKGDTVIILSTARKISITELSFAKKFLEKEGYKVLFGRSIGLEHHQFAGTDNERALDFQAAIDNPNIKAIWCARGGYGTVRILDKLNFDSFIKSPKWIIGYSDVTALHSKIDQLGIASIHAPMAFDLEKCTQEIQTNFSSLLKGHSPNLDFLAHPLNKIGTVTGEAIGGNLSVLYSLCGSSDGLDTDGKILFLEDLDEYLYHIDRMFQNLKRNKYLDNLAALVIGGMTHMHDNKIPFGYTVEEIVLEATKGFNYPVIFNAPFGHISDNQPVIFGGIYKLKATKERVELKLKAHS